MVEGKVRRKLREHDIIESTRRSEWSALSNDIVLLNNKMIFN